METSHLNIPLPISTVPFLQFPRRNWSSHVPYPLSSAHSLPWSNPFAIVVSQPYGKLFLQRLWTPSTQARRQGGIGDIALPIFVFALPIYFLPPNGIFLGGKICCFWPEKTFKFVISARKSLWISAKTFFLFLEITCFRPEKTFKSVISARKSLRISAKTFFFYWRSPDFH